MSSTTSKHQDFVSEPMGDKLVTALPGIGEALGGRLEEQGIKKAYVLLGKFLCYKKDEARFSEWLKDKTQANVHQADLCTRCLKEWCNAFL